MKLALAAICASLWLGLGAVARAEQPVVQHPRNSPSAEHPVAAGTPREALMNPPQWFASPYAYVLVEQDVRAALQELGHNLGVAVVFSDKVRGKARSTIHATTAGDFLTQLCDSNGLTWYFDGSVLYLSSDDEIATRLFQASPERLQALSRYLSELDVSGPRLGQRDGPERGELLVSGPPPYLALVQQHMEYSAPAPTPPAPRERGVRVFRGSAVTQQ